MDEILSRNKNLARGFRNLDIWQNAIKLYCYTHDLLTKNPKICFKIKEQIEDSSFSVHSNIAEGYTRRSIKDTHKYYVIALSSSSECYSQMYALLESKQVERSDFDKFDTKSFELQNKLLNMNKALLDKISNNQGWNSEY